MMTTAEGHNFLIHLYISAASGPGWAACIAVCHCVVARFPALSTDSRPVAVTQHMVNTEQRRGWTKKRCGILGIVVLSFHNLNYMNDDFEAAVWRLQTCWNHNKPPHKCFD